MYGAKYFRKLITASAVIGAFTFTPQVYHLPMVSIAQAAVQTYTGVGDYIMQRDQTPDFAIQNAKMYAARNATESAGIAVINLKEVQQHKLTKDEIITFTAGIVKIDTINVETILLNENESGYIKYIVTVKAQIDTDELNAKIDEWLKRGDDERKKLIEQNKQMQQMIDDLQKRIKDLEQNAVNAKTVQEKSKVNEDFATIIKDSSYAQKLDEGDKLHMQGKYQDAIKIYNEAMQLNANDYKVYFYRGNAYSQLREYRQAINDYTKSISLNPQNDWAYNNRGVAYVDIGDYKRALLNYNRAIQLNPKFDMAYYNRGIAHFHLRDYNRAIANYTKAIELNPQYDHAYNNRGWTYYHMKHFTKAIENYSKAIELNPNISLYYNNRAAAYQGLGKMTQAQADYAKAEELENKK